MLVGGGSDCTVASDVTACIIDIGSLDTKVGDEGVISLATTLLQGVGRLSFGPLDRFVGTTGTTGFSPCCIFAQFWDESVG